MGLAQGPINPKNGVMFMSLILIAMNNATSKELQDLQKHQKQTRQIPNPNQETPNQEIPNREIYQLQWQQTIACLQITILATKTLGFLILVQQITFHAIIVYFQTLKSRNQALSLQMDPIPTLLDLERSQYLQNFQIGKYNLLPLKVFYLL